MSTYRDVTHVPGSAAAAGMHRELASLTAQGFGPLARIAVEPADIHAVAAHFREPDASWLLENAGRPSTVLQSPSCDAVVEVSEWFDRTPHLRFRSLLDDGAVVETRTRVARGPLNAGPSDGFDPLGSDAPGRSIRLATGEVDAQWSAHREHLATVLAARGARPVPLDTPGVIALSRRLSEHDHACESILGRNVIRAIGFLGLGVVIVVANALALGAPNSTLGALIALPLLTSEVGSSWVTRALRHAPLRRPAWIGEDPPERRWIPYAAFALVAVVISMGAAWLGGVVWWALVALGAAATWAGSSLVGALVWSDALHAPGMDASARAALGLAEDPALITALQVGDRDALVARLEAAEEPSRELRRLSHYLPDATLEAWSASDDPRGALALGWAHIERAWRARGSGWGAEVTARGHTTFDQHLDAAERAFLEAAERDKSSADAWAGVIVARRAKGLEAAWEAFERVLTRDPLHAEGHSLIFEHLKQKWGGSHEAMFDFARRAPDALAWLVPEAHAEYADIEESDAHFEDPGVRREVEEAWARCRAAGTPSVHACNVFAGYLSAMGAEDAARDATSLVGRRVREYPWNRWGDPLEVYLETRAELNLPRL